MMDEHKLFVGNMAARITQRDLWRFFSPYGPIDECAKFHESYAFVRFVNADDAQRARQQTHGAILKGRKLKVEFAATKCNTSSSTTQPSKVFYIQPLRRTPNLPISPTQFEPKSIDQDWFSNGSSTSEDFFRWNTFDDSFDFNLSPQSNSRQDSRYFPLSTTRTDFSHSIALTPQENPLKNEIPSMMLLDFNRIRLFSDVSSGFGDDSNLFIDAL